MFDQFHFLAPQWLWALLPLAPLLWGLRRRSGGANPWRGVVDERLLPHLLVAADGGPRKGPLLLFGIGWLIAVLALANPTWERLPTPVYKGQQAVVVVLDLSQSMLTADLPPSRLQRARFKISDLLTHNADGQTALVAFAGDAFVVAPLSDDRATVDSLLAALEPALMPLPGSRPDLGIEAAQRLLNQAGVSHGEVLLVADDSGDPRAIDAARQLRDAGHRLSVLSVGSADGGPLPAARGGMQRDASGQVVVTAVDADAMRALAEAGGGRYAPVSADDRDLQALFPAQELAMDTELQQSELSTERWNEIGPWLALLLLPLGLVAFRRGWLLALLAVVLAGGGVVTPQPAMAFSWDDLWQRADQQSAAALAAGDAERAAALAQDPLRRGSAEFVGGDYAAAADTFAAGQDADARYNRGNALAKLGKYEEAIAAYDEALAEVPDMEDAAWNKAQVEALLKQQQQQKQEQQGGKDQQQQDGDSSQDQAQDGQQGQEGEDGKQSGEQQAGSEGEQSQDAEGQQGQQGQSGQQQADGQQGDQQGEDGQQSQQADNQQQPGQQGQQSDEQGDEQGDEQLGRAQASGSDQQGEEADQQQAEAGEPGEQDEQAQAGQQGQADSEGEPGKDGKPGDATAEAEPMDSEQKLAMEQWLRRIPDDPGGLLRRKFLYQYRQRGAAPGSGSAQPW